MRRRSFLTVLGGAAGAWPLSAGAQQPAVPVVGYLNAGPPEPWASRVAAFRQGLSEVGFVEGRNLAIEYRWAHDDYDRLPELAADLVRRRVDVIAGHGSTVAPLAAKAATATIPIVFLNGADPVQTGLVASFNRPGGNVTGISTMSAELGGKRLGLLHALLPGAVRFAVLVNPNNQPITALVIADAQSAAFAIGRQIEVLSARSSREIDAAFEALEQSKADALLVNSDPLFNTRRSQLVTLAAHYRKPTIYWTREDAIAGGLMSYGHSVTEADRQVGIYVGRILKGERPAELPVMRPTKFELVINLQTARMLRIAVPPTLLAIADEVIE